jgi:hypothetical protein
MSPHHFSLPNRKPPSTFHSSRGYPSPSIPLVSAHESIFLIHSTHFSAPLIKITIHIHFHHSVHSQHNQDKSTAQTHFDATFCTRMPRCCMPHMDSRAHPFQWPDTPDNYSSRHRTAAIFRISLFTAFTNLELLVALHCIYCCTCWIAALVGYV